MSVQEVTIGIDIGGTNTKIGLVSNDGKALFHRSIPTYAEQSTDVFIPHLKREIENMFEEAGSDVVAKAVGVGVPNGNYYKGTVEMAPNLNWGDEVPLAEMIKEVTGLPVVLTNDANAAALGEMQFGVAKGMKNFVVVTLGTGLGSGIVVNGQLLYGQDGFAGELGHILVDVNGRTCGRGRKGCLEGYVSATGIKRTVYELLADMNEKSELRSISYDDLSAEMITEAAKNGDPVAQAAFEYTGRILGMKLADTVAILSPEAIILFGGLAHAGDLLLEPTQQYMEKYMLEIFKNKVKLLFSNLKGDNTAVLGAAALAWTEIQNGSTTS